jgi:hypothetical protein
LIGRSEKCIVNCLHSAVNSEQSEKCMLGRLRSAENLKQSAIQGLSPGYEVLERSGKIWEGREHVLSRFAKVVKSMNRS